MMVMVASSVAGRIARKGIVPWGRVIGAALSELQRKVDRAEFCEVTGRGIGYSQRNGTRVAVIAEGDVDRGSGRIYAHRFVVAHDCGQIIDPDGLHRAIEGNILQGISRTLWGEVRFNDKNVTTVDWVSYPILDITETPASIETALIDYPAPRPEPGRRADRAPQ